MSQSILITGAAGKLGAAVWALLPEAIGATRADFDLSNTNQMSAFLDRCPQVTTILHCAAMISPPKINEDIPQAIQSNIIGTALLSAECYKRNIRLVYISTDYVFAGEKGMYKEGDELLPQNKYAWSKLGGECAVQMLDNYVIIRLSFGPDIFPYKAAFIDQYTSRESASVIAKKIKNIVVSDFKGVIHIGGDRKSVYEYALSLGAENIDKISVKDMSVKMPTDTSLDCSLYKQQFDKD
jgi:dTDP-4-dehydrorhamnose reductase